MSFDTTFRRRSAFGVASLSLAMVLTACAGADDESAEPAASMAASEAAAPSEAAAGDAAVLVADSDLGEILTDADGNVIYFFANDAEGEPSTCEGDCFANWPPVPAEGTPTAGEGVDAELGTTEATDGTTMLTVNGYPAYYFAGDEAAGDTNGQGVGEVWWVFGPDGEPIEG
jgi:predicted lipoprotein with Yx(FWY)xxD motif